MKVEDRPAALTTTPTPVLPGLRAPQLPAPRRLPVGAEVRPGGGVHFRVWAPRAAGVVVQWSRDPDFPPAGTRRLRLNAEAGGYFSGVDPEAETGVFYRFELPHGVFPDPASRYQPHGPHGPSQVVDPGGFRWTDQTWRGLSRPPGPGKAGSPRGGQVLYELHVGTFTQAGTWSAAREELDELARLGVTVIELMPVGEFPGRFGWGYDGVDLFAPTHLYGTPDEFRAFIDRAHAVGLAVILDVVYNHLGPDGNFLKEFSKDYFTDRYRNEWGEAVNFDGPCALPVREFFCANTAYWISEFHLDGLRLDATQQMFDASPTHILAELSRVARQAGGDRITYLVGENEPQQVQLLRPAAVGGCELDALWNDDFHHSAMVALTGRHEAYYMDYRGTPQEFVSAMKWGFLYQGQWYAWQKKRRGSPTRELEPERLINFLQNHDQVANSMRGLRLHQLTSPGRWRALTALLLLGPATPMLFQGQEFCASTPFLYFADHNPELARLVANGRQEFLSQFPTMACPQSASYLAPPAAETTFQRSKLDLSERQRHHEAYRLHEDLLRLRRQDPVFAQVQAGRVDGAVLGGEGFVLRFFGGPDGDRLLLVNLGSDLQLSPAPEPLLAPVAGGDWTVAWSSEAPEYGGCGTPPLDCEREWRILGHAALVLTSQANHGEAHPAH